MRTTALVLGIIGGVFGIFAALFALAVGGISSAANVKGGGQVVALGYAAFFVSIAAIVGGALAPRKPRAAALLLLLTGIGGFICVSAFWLLSGPLLLVGALLAFLSRERAETPQRAPEPQYAPPPYTPPPAMPAHYRYEPPPGPPPRR